MAFLNTDDKPWTYEINLNGNRIYDGDFNTISKGIYQIDDSFTIRDLWKHQKIGSSGATLRIMVPGHDLVLIRLIKE
jgi:hypothetical protein